MKNKGKEPKWGMAQKGNYFCLRSIRAKIMVTVGGVAILAMIISAIVTINTVVDTVVKDEEYISTLSTDLVVADIDKYFAKYIAMAGQMALDGNIREILADAATSQNFKENTKYSGAYLTLNNTMLSDKENILSAYIAAINSDLAFDGGDWVADQGFDLSSRSYWFSNQEDIDRRYIVTEPYQDLDTGNMVITISVPVYDMSNSKIIGIAGIDVTITALSDMVLNAETTYPDAYQILVSSDGYVLAHRESDKLLTPVSDIGFGQALIDKIYKPDDEVVEFRDNGEECFGLVKTTDYAKWKVALIVPEKDFMKVANDTKQSLAAICIVSIIILFIVIYIVTKNIVAPLKKLTIVTDELAKGNLDMEIQVNSLDEVGQLADSMRSLVVRLGQYINYIDEVSTALDQFADGSLNIVLKQKYDGEFARIKTSLLQVSYVFKETIGQIIETSDKVASGSGEISNAAQMLAQGATNQASTTEELTATINDLSEHVSQNANHAISAAEQVRTVGTAADQSNEQMREMIRSIAEINEKSAEIGKIIKVIEDIAFQTNILALNAAVEAARAGNAGKGFAVVADEVRNLASKSADAAKDTTRLIQETIKAVENGTSIANITGEKLGQVIEGVSQTVDLIKEISGASVGQASALKQTLEGVQQISEVVQTNAATAEESSAASIELSKQANELKQVATQFKIQ
jgi:methyl-accepting chemotaxis protein